MDARTHGEAVVIGSGHTAWRDLSSLGAAPRAAFAVNEMIILSPHVHHAVSHHADKLAHWDALRTRAGWKRRREAGIVTHSSAAGPGVARVWPEYRTSGSSSLLAVRIALALGYERVVVAGVPLDAGGYVWSDPKDDGPAHDYAPYRQVWADALDELRGRVVAPSGFLRELLGAPTC